MTTPTTNLPAPLADAQGVLDLDAMRDALPAVRTGLVDALRHAATLAREARGTVVVEEDTYPLVRRLTEAGEVLRQWGSAFTAAAAEADALIAEEALGVPGAESDGALSSALYVPDGAGQRIAVRPNYRSGSSTWDVPTLVGWLVDDEVRDAMSTLPTDPGDVPAPVVELYRDALGDVARNVVARLIGLDGVAGLGKYEPGAKAVEALRKRLAEAGRDADAGVIRQVRSTSARTYLGIKVEREPTPGGAA